MPPNLSREDIINTARKHEKRFNWLQAAKTYEQLCTHAQKDELFCNAEIHEKIGFCYTQASTQVDRKKDFVEFRKQAAKAYEKAAELFRKKSKRQGHGTQCEAISKYLESSLASDPDEKRELLDNCLSLCYSSLESYKDLGDNEGYGKMCNNTTMFLLERYYVSSDMKEMEDLAKEGMKYGKIGIDVWSKLGDKDELLRAYSVASLQGYYISTCQPDATSLVPKSLEYSKKAIELSKGASTPHYIAVSHWAAALCKLVFTEEANAAQEHATQMLEQAEIIRDNYLKGVAYYLLTFVTDWLAIREADPDERKKDYEKVIKYAKDALQHLAPDLKDFFIAETCLFYAEAYSSLAKDFATNLEEKHVLQEKAIDIGRKGLEHARNSGSADATGSTLHALSKALHFYANLSTVDEKKVMLEEALQHRIEYMKIVKKVFAGNEWVHGVGESYLGLIKADMAKVEAAEDNKVALLGSAISDVEEGLKNCEKWISSHPVPTAMVAVAEFENSAGRILGELHSLTQDNKLLTRAVEVYGYAARNYKKASLSSRVAESHWRRAQIYDNLGSYNEATDDFENASKEYSSAAQEIPQFADFYEDYATYMKAWSEIEKAKFAHSQRNYAEAMNCYKSGADLLNQSRLWNYLSSNFHAWAFLEKAEGLSREEKSEESIGCFRKAIEVFLESGVFLRAQIDRIERSDEKTLAERLMIAAEKRAKYCHGRIALEEAKTLDRQGDHKASAEKYGFASNAFGQITETESQQTRQELIQLVHLCQAWQKMMMAEAMASPQMYGEAAELFKQAKEYALDQSTSLLTLASSSFCRALEAGTEFEITRDRALYIAVKRHIGAAANYFLKAGFVAESAYAEATQRLFDAYVFMDSAKRETDPEKEARYYAMAEKVLQASVNSFKEAKHKEKTEQAQQLLMSVEKERELALSLGEVLHAPTITSSTKSFVTLTPSEESAAGLERFDHADIQAKLVQRVKETRIGDIFDLELHIVNVGKESVLIDSVEEIVPEGFESVSAPGYCQIEGRGLKLRGKRLFPLKTEEMTLSLKPFKKGSFLISPRIVCVDQNGRQTERKPQPTQIDVLEATLPGRITTGDVDLDNLLLGGIPENYAVILSSPSCDERDLLVRRFLEAGVKAGQVTFYVTIEALGVKDLVKEYETTFYLFICNPRADAMIESSPNVFKLKGVENITNLTIALTSAFRQLNPNQTGPRRACIEIISDVLLHHHAVVTRTWLAGLIPDLRAKGFSTLAIINPMMHPSEEVHAIVGLFEGDISIVQKSSEKGVQKFLKVEKLYNQKYLEGEMPFRKREKSNA